MSRTKANSTDDSVLTEGRLAELSGYTVRRIKQLVEEGVLTKSADGFAALDSLASLIRHLRQNTGSKAAYEKERAEKTRLEREALERQAAKDQGEWLEASIWLDKLSEHFGDLRSKFKLLLLTDQPATLSGRTEVDIREANGKTYAQVCRWMQNAATKLRPAASSGIVVNPE